MSPGRAAGSRHQHSEAEVSVPVPEPALAGGAAALCHMSPGRLGRLPPRWPSASKKGLDSLSVDRSLRLFTALPILK